MSKGIETLVGQKIKEIRVKRGLTQEELAEKTVIDYKYLQRIEGKKPPNLTIKTISRIAEALGISPAKLFE